MDMSKIKFDLPIVVECPRFKERKHDDGKKKKQQWKPFSGLDSHWHLADARGFRGAAGTPLTATVALQVKKIKANHGTKERGLWDQCMTKEKYEEIAQANLENEKPEEKKQT